MERHKYNRLGNTEDVCSIEEAQEFGIVGYQGISLAEVINLEKIRKAMGITPLSIEEQIKNRREFKAYKKTQDWIDAKSKEGLEK